MRENCTYGSMRGIRRKTAKHVLRIAKGRAGVPHGASRSTLRPSISSLENVVFRQHRPLENVVLSIANSLENVVHFTSDT